MRTAISYGVFTPLLVATGFLRRRAWVEVAGSRLRVKMGWGFDCDVPLDAVTGAHRWEGRRPISIGVHGWAGRWLVNGSRKGLVVVDIDPPQRARVAKVPIRLRQLIVSVEDPDALVAALP